MYCKNVFMSLEFRDMLSRFTRQSGGISPEDAQRLLEIQTERMRYTITALRALKEQVWNLHTNDAATWASQESIRQALEQIAQKESVWVPVRASSESVSTTLDGIESDIWAPDQAVAAWVMVTTPVPSALGHTGEKNTHERNNISSLRDLPGSVGIFGDSLTVGMLNTAKIAPVSSNAHAKVWASIQAIRQNFETYLTNNPGKLNTAYILAGTNNIISANASSIISELEAIKSTAQRHRVQVVLGTIPPLWVYIRNNPKISARFDAIESAREKVNQHIRSQVSYIDYDAILRSPTDSHILARSSDGLHPSDSQSMSQALLRSYNQQIS